MKHHLAGAWTGAPLAGAGFSAMAGHARGDGAASGPAAVGGVKGLRHMAKAVHDAFLDIVIAGKRETLGMPEFEGKPSEDDAGAIHAYVTKRAPDDDRPNFIEMVRRPTPPEAK
jgi:hypothetical protein